MDRIIRTCSTGLALALLAASGTAEAKRETPAPEAPLALYARARIAAADGALGDAAKGYSELLNARPDDAGIAARAYRAAIVAGDFDLALKAAAALDKAGALPADGRLLYFARAVKAGDWKTASAALDAVEQGKVYDFMAPVLRAWVAVGSGRKDAAAALDAASGNALGNALAAEQRPLLLLAAGKLDEGTRAAQAQALLSGAGGVGMKLAAAARLQAAGRKDAALALLNGEDAVSEAARAALAAGRPLRAGSPTPAGGIGVLLIRVGEAVQADPRSPVALTLARFAYWLDPANDGAAVSLARLLAGQGQGDEALTVLAQVPETSPFAALAFDGRVQILADLKRTEDALALAKTRSERPEASLADVVRTADLLTTLGRHKDAAELYNRAITLAERDPPQKDRLWTFWLLAGGAWEQAGDWAKARPALEKAVALGPDQPAALNYLGYAELERHENTKAAMAMLAKASALKPDDPAITDSLGWAHYLAGDVKAAIPALERAVKGQPADPAINEHLGDAYWTAGRRYEARYAWRAAAVFADAADEQRLQTKIANGLSPAVAAK